MRSRILITIFLITCITAFTNRVKAQSASDTVVTYYRYSYYEVMPFPEKVKSLDSADYIKITYPDSGRVLYTVKEYYKSGVKKFIGQIEGKMYEENGINELTGYCINYYPNGKKRNVANYIKSYKNGLEYLYKPDGKLYGVVKWINNGYNDNAPLLWNYYNDKGKLTCENGNGTWDIYNQDVDLVVYTGNVINGYMQGEWKGGLMLDDSIKYICNFKKSHFINGVGYDKQNRAHPFTKMLEPYEYKGALHYGTAGLIDFVIQVNRHLTLPRDSKGDKINIDTVHFTFVVEKDGSLSGVRLLGHNPQLQDALTKAVARCDGWNPSRICGVPYRTQLALTLKVSKDFLTRAIGYNGKLLILPKLNTENLDGPSK